MKKNYKSYTKYLLAVCLIFTGSVILTAQGYGFEVQKDAYNKTPEGNIANGLPKIGFPLLSVPTSSPKLSFNFGIDYNANRASNLNLPGDVGKGWNLSADYAVVRVSHGLPADYQINHQSPGLYSNVNSGNVFQYSIPGESARFMINYDKAAHQYVGISEDGFKSKILIEKNISDTLVYKIKSFTVIDAKGLKYIFDKPDISYYRGIGDTHLSQKRWVDLYHGAFHITKILDAKDNILATFEYLTSTGTVSDSRGSYAISQSKISQILIPNIGSISFMYQGSWDIAFPQMVPLPKIMVKDVAGRIINQVVFEFIGSYLNSFSTLDKKNAVLEKYTFEYNIGLSNSFDQFGFPNNLSYCSIDGNERFFSPVSPNPRYSTEELLRAVHLPTGGKTEYEFESNTISTPSPYYSYPGYFDGYQTDVVYEADFFKQLTDPPLILNVNPSQYQRYFVTADGVTYFKSTDRIDHYSVDYYITKATDGSSLNDLFTYHDMETDTYKTCDDLKTFTPPSNSAVRINIAGKASGHIKVYGIRTTEAPFSYTEGVRIKNIKKYEGADSSVPTENLNYEYNSFDNPQASSAEDYGIISYPLPSGLEKVMRQMVYKNVMVTDLVRNFFTKYTFKLPSEVGLSGITVLDFGAPYNTGLPVKIEQYTSGNQLVSEKNFEYTFSSKPLSDRYLVPADFRYPLLQKQTVTEKAYRENNTVLTTATEKVYEPGYSNLISEKTADFSGETVEATYKYASEMQNQTLLSANKIATPVVTEIKSTRSGITTPLSKTENLYTMTSSSEPSGMIAYDPVNGTPSTETVIDQYDAYGHVIQVTGKDGVTNCIVYGYHGTLPIAKISGISYDALQSQGLLNAIITASDADADNPANEGQLLNALNAFRRNAALKDLPVVTHTYDPLVGVTSETDAAGIRKVYQYDNANRLIKILDGSGNTLQEFRTHLKAQ